MITRRVGGVELEVEVELELELNLDLNLNLNRFAVSGTPNNASEIHPSSQMGN